MRRAHGGRGGARGAAGIGRRAPPRRVAAAGLRHAERGRTARAAKRPLSATSARAAPPAGRAVDEASTGRDALKAADDDRRRRCCAIHPHREGHALTIATPAGTAGDAVRSTHAEGGHALTRAPPGRNADDAVRSTHAEGGHALAIANASRNAGDAVQPHAHRGGHALTRAPPRPGRRRCCAVHAHREGSRAQHRERTGDAHRLLRCPPRLGANGPTDGRRRGEGCDQAKRRMWTLRTRPTEAKLATIADPP
jgi:hypothetical protein